MISDIICLTDGRLIIVEIGRRVSLLTPDGKLQKHLPIYGETRSVTQINQDTIALIYLYERVIKIFNMENGTVTKVIKLNKVCYGLSSSDNSLVVGLYNDEIRIVDLEGNTLKSIQVQCISTLLNFVYCNDRVIYSDFIDKVIYCVDGSGKQIWQYTQDLEGPKGLCIDTYGNTIVSDSASKRIIVISKDGKESKVLHSGGDGPAHICLNHCESSCFSCDGKYLTIFNLSSG
ncbi:unnamed protein product [Mytilus edulis]|uniref:Uncharacterized protein n=1 Tax=Mytilus edulis TaxID=6550 RepID=A0A8S3TX09_MYTED|nr:unnamed protein product [Mytilus edulis]